MTRDLAFILAVNTFIPQAVQHADERTISKYGRQGKRIVNGTGKDKIRMRDLNWKQLQEYERILTFWNKCYHNQMHKLTVRAGIRTLPFKAEIR